MITHTFIELPMSFPRFPLASSHLNSSRPQQTIADSEATGVFSYYPSFLIVIDWNSINSFMNFGIEGLTNGLDTFNTSVKQRIFKTCRSAANPFDYRVERSTTFSRLNCAPQILHYG
jgi:hypothetical protein